MVAGEKEKYEAWRTGEIERLQGDIVIAQNRADILQHYLDSKGTAEEASAKEDMYSENSLYSSLSSVIKASSPLTSLVL